MCVFFYLFITVVYCNALPAVNATLNHSDSKVFTDVTFSCSNGDQFSNGLSNINMSCTVEGRWEVRSLHLMMPVSSLMDPIDLLTRGCKGNNVKSMSATKYNRTTCVFLLSSS